MKAKGSYASAVDAYIAGAEPFAQPILTHLRELMHKGAPEVEETMKWSRPFFVYRGIILANLSAFKQHCSLGLWGPEIAAKLREDGLYSREAMGVLGRLTSVKDLPGDREMLGYIRSAAAVIDDGTRTKSLSRPKRAAAKPVEVPEAFASALRKNKTAAKQFSAMPLSAQREYCEWVSEAKREETREKRVATAVEWIAEGKRRNWQYETRA